jgi:hypothetical protein
MEPLDEWARDLAKSESRRTMLRKATVGLAVALLSTFGFAGSAQARNSQCRSDKDCPPDYVCVHCPRGCYYTKCCLPPGAWSCCGCPDGG